MLQFFSSMTRRARVAFGLGVLVIALVVGAAGWWLSHPPYGVLFRDLRDSDAAEISSTLGQMQVPYRLADEGRTILVPAETVYETRMRLISQGVPKGGSVGFELFKDSDYGVTEFAQKVNFQRALQGELERTIASLDEVAAARVHLTIHRSELFETEKTPSKASVTLTLRPQKHLEAREVAGIQRLVASAVDSLSPESVVVLDDKGMQLSGYSANGQAAGDGLDAQTQMEARLRTRVGELLHRVLQTDDFTVSVDVRLNYDRVKQVREQLLPQGKDGNGLLVREKLDSTGRAVDDGDVEHPKAGNTSSNRELEYAHGREQEEVERAPGRVERVSVGIVVPAVLPPAQLSKLSDVVSAGLGLDAARGDKVDIAAIAPLQRAAVTPAPVAAAEDKSAPGSDEVPVVASQSPMWMYPVVALLVLVVIGAFAMALRGGSGHPRRLSHAEREEALLRLRQWIESNGVER
ncbi:flagellar basal-body MS-ring/collar protein FliF [Dyella sp.]|uniref:flagellar basal-body MS-ring/collar protein FliF n=1 Tax=Dyella sp. TaxID=1869338 RepID=UPI002ED4E090